jgi:hypothetical protein
MEPSQLLIVQIFAAIGTVLGAAVLFGKIILPFFKRISKWMHTWEDFMEDWFGEETRAGRSRTKGVMERLNEIDGELKNNGGSSLKDAVDRIESGMIKIDKRLEEGNKRFDNIEDRLNDLEK